MPTFGPTNPDRDTTIAQRPGVFEDFNYGARTSLIFDYLGTGSTDAARMLMGWPADDFPIGAIIESALLWWKVQSNTLALELDCEAFPVIPSKSTGLHFVEGTGNASATGDGATWNLRDESDSWESPGGDFDSDSASVFSINPSDTTREIDVRVALQSALTHYRDAENRVALLFKRQFESGSWTQYRIWSREALNPADAPKLTVAYRMPTAGRPMPMRRRRNRR